MKQSFRHAQYPGDRRYLPGIESRFYRGPVIQQPPVETQKDLRTLKPKALKVIRAAWAHGVRGLFKLSAAAIYRNLVRPWMAPVGFVYYAGIPVSYTRKWGDESVSQSFLPEYALDAPDYESALVAGLRAHVREGDHVVVVGGGVGVTATIAAMESGPSGSVICFEAGRESTEMVRRTAFLNGVSERMTVVHAVVARPVCPYGTLPDDDLVLPQDLPSCDVLELDCEGAELDILESMIIRPRVVLVETHGYFGSSTSEVTSLLLEYGYSVTCLGAAEPRVQAFCEKNDIQVVVGTAAKRRLSA